MQTEWHFIQQRIREWQTQVGEIIKLGWKCEKWRLLWSKKKHYWKLNHTQLWAEAPPLGQALCMCFLCTLCVYFKNYTLYLNLNTNLENVNSGGTMHAKCQHVLFKDSRLCCNWLCFLILYSFHVLFFPLKTKWIFIWREFWTREKEYAPEPTARRCEMNKGKKSQTQTNQMPFMLLRTLTFIQRK